jgi:thiol-disulfide isomerase/thioredoxin
VILPALTVDAPETNLYKGDDAEITILSEGVPVEGVEVYLDGVWKQNSDEYGMAMLSSLSGGLHLIYGVKEGYLNASLNLTVSNLTYAYSGDAKIQHTQDERNRMISQGKIILIFFDLPGCANCALMRPWIAELANENRGCIEYEWLNLAGVSEGPRNELREVIQDEDQVSTPVIIIQGENGSLLSSGFKSRDAIIDMISRVSNGGCFSET